MSEPAGESGGSLAHRKMQEVMKVVRALAKDEVNQQQGFNFRGVDSVMNAVGPALRDQGLVVESETKSITIGSFTTQKGTPMNHSVVEMRYLFTAEDGSFTHAEAFGEASDTLDKATPKAMSVAYRTAILQALCLPTHEPDPDQGVLDYATEDAVKGDDGVIYKDRRNERLAYLRAVINAKGLNENDGPAAFQKRYGMPIGEADIDGIQTYIDHVQKTGEL